MTAPTAWQAPDPEAGPAPGIEFAGFGARLVAYIIDTVVILILAIGLGIIAGLAVFVMPLLSILPILAILIVPLVYFPYFWQKSGQTPGKRMMGIKVVRDSDGGPLTWGMAIIRLVGYWVSGLVFYLGYIWIFIDKRKRGWHDLIASTVVIKVP